VVSAQFKVLSLAGDPCHASQLLHAFALQLVPPSLLHLSFFLILGLIVLEHAS
jgi:hypothetical protein